MKTEKDSFYSLSAVDADGKERSFSEFENCAVVIVNIASNCGFAKKNYENLAGLLERFKDRGLKVLLFPNNQFLNQEPNEIGIIKEKVDKYSKDFILFDKIDVVRKNIHPVFSYLCKKKGGWIGEFVKWNFTKFLVDKNGDVVKRYASHETISPEKIEGML